MKIKNCVFGGIAAAILVSAGVVSADAVQVTSRPYVDKQVTAVDTKVGDTGALKTEAKNNTVAAINELADGFADLADFVSGEGGKFDEDGTLTDNTVDTGAIIDGAVTNDKLGAGSVTSDKIQDGTIVEDDLNPSLVEKIDGKEDVKNKVTNAADYKSDLESTTKYPSMAVAAKIVSDVLADKGLDGDDGISGDLLEDKSITDDKLADGAVTNDKLAPDSVTSDKIQDGTIVEDDLSSELAGKLNAKQDHNIGAENGNQILVTDESGDIVSTEKLSQDKIDGLSDALSSLQSAIDGITGDDGDIADLQSQLDALVEKVGEGNLNAGDAKDIVTAINNIYVTLSNMESSIDDVLNEDGEVDGDKIADGTVTEDKLSEDLKKSLAGLLEANCDQDLCVLSFDGTDFSWTKVSKPLN